MPHSVVRSRTRTTLLLIGTIALGLASRRYPDAFPAFIARYGGDALWASMVFWLLALLRPAAWSIRLAAIAFAISVAVECSQLYHATWLDALRATRLGALALGHGFLWSDIACYLVGVVLAAAVDRVLRPVHRRAAGADDR